MNESTIITDWPQPTASFAQKQFFSAEWTIRQFTGTCHTDTPDMYAIEFAF